MFIARILFLIIIIFGMLALFVTSAHAAETLQAYYYGPATANQTCYGDVYLAQTFRLSDPVEVTRVRLPVSGDDIDWVKVSIRNCYNVATYDAPMGSDQAICTLAGENISNSTAWTDFEFTSSYSLSANTTYAIVMRAPIQESADPIRWESSNVTYTYGYHWYSSTAGVGTPAWTRANNTDMLFELYGDVDMEIVDAKVFSSFSETDDWLVTIHFENTASPYYTYGYMAEKSFRLQLLDAANNTIGENVIRGWGSRPGSIYLKANQTAVLDWRGDYRIRMTATGITGGTSFYVSHEIESDDWIGSDLEILDDWCREVARLMGVYDTGDENYYLTEASGVGLVLNSYGASMFENGVPGLSNIRGHYLMEAYIRFEEEEKQAHPISELYDYDVQLGPQIVGVAEDIGDTFNLNERIILGLFLVVVGIGCMALLPPTYASAGMVVFTWVVGGIGLASGIVQVAYIALVAFVVWVLMFKALTRGVA